MMRRVMMAVLMLGVMAAPALAGDRPRQATPKRPGSSHMIYRVRLHTGNFRSVLGKASFGLVETSPSSSLLSIYEFATAGVMAAPETEGGLASGDILLGVNPAYYTSINPATFYYSHLGAVLDTLGPLTTFTFEYAGTPPGLEYDDTFAFSLLGANDASLFTTSDPLGANAIFVASLTGNPGASVEIYDPAVLVPGPSDYDTIVVYQGSVGVEIGTDGLPRALGFRRVFPNPTLSRTTIEFGVPSGIGPVEMGVFDVQGRRLARLTPSPIGPGFHSLIWDGSGAGGRRLPPGVYLLRLQAGTRAAVVHKLVLGR